MNFKMRNRKTDFLKFPPCKAVQPLRGMGLQEQEVHEKLKIKAYNKSVQKEPTIKRFLLVLDLKAF